MTRLRLLLRAVTIVSAACVLVACATDRDVGTPISIASSPTTTAPRSASPAIAPPSLLAPQPTDIPVSRAGTGCTPTFSDDLSPTYKANAPPRTVVGRGHRLRGTVRSSRDCAPIVHATLELWPEAPNGDHPDRLRATIFTDDAGAYTFECEPTDHIHMRVSADGYRTITSNAYHPGGRVVGTFDIVLAPAG